jgi:hypothetical protein
MNVVFGAIPKTADEIEVEVLNNVSARIFVAKSEMIQSLPSFIPG